MKKIIISSLLLAGFGAGAEDKVNCPIADGPFKGEVDSLKQYRCPDWFRDAKFGMWAHWGPQAVPEMGDWYAKRMYLPADAKYKDHLERYGHPSEHGFKDIIPLWKAEKWDPERLMALYKKAGARYFVSMGSHHDNFFLWNSKLHKWNSVNMGPKRDVVGDWQKAAKAQGMRFGVSEHLGASFTWFQPSHGSDKTGPKAGVPYDGANPQWQDLYHFSAEPGDNKWYSTNPKWHQQWYNEIKELVDNYKPDLLYTDGGVAFGPEHPVGLSMIAHLYNTKPDAVYNCKQVSEGRWVHDLERGVMPGVQPYPWQTDTSIGDWYYNKTWKFRPVSWTIHMLCDIVSKNGNLLLNIVQRPDGSLDPEVEQQLADLATWINIHGEAIYGTRPWLVYGEGSVSTKGGNFKEDFAYSAKDIRFTTKAGTLYAIALGWPVDNTLVVKSLAASAGKITDVILLGSATKLDWKQTGSGLVVTLPAEKVSVYTAALKIIGGDLKPVAIAEEAVIVQPAASGQGVVALHPPLLVASYSRNAAYIVSTNGTILWQSDKMPGACQDAWLLSNNHVLLSGGNQVREVTADKKTVWQYEAPKGVAVEIHNCQPLPGGGALIGEGGTCRLLELDNTGKIAKEIKLSLGGNTHSHMRQVRKTSKGTYLVTAAGENNIREYDAQGKELRVVLGTEIKKQGVKWPIVHSAELLGNGNLLIGGAYGAPVIEVDPAGQIVWKLSAEDIPEVGFAYSAGCLRLTNGNTVVAAYTSKFPIFEVTPGKKVVWKLQNPAIGNPTHVKLLTQAEVGRFLKSAEK